MPRKRNVGRALPMKQKNLLKSRLMQIQIFIDDYVYNDKRISVSDARGYIEEVEAYRAQGIEDVRYLQVIEKIIRCMKGMIKEQQEENHADNTNCPSPVYSLPDEDKLLFTQEPMNIDNTENLDDTTDIFAEDDIHQNMQADVEIHRAMSELSIREDDTQIFEQCSQSILHNLESEVVEILQTPKPNFNINQKEFQRKPTQDLNSNDPFSINHNRKAITAQKDLTKNVQFQDDDVIFIEPTQPRNQNSEPKVVGILKTPKSQLMAKEFPSEPISGLNSIICISADHNSTTTTPQKLLIKNVHFQDDDIIFVEPTPPIAKTKQTIKKKLNQNGTEKKTRRKKNLNNNDKKNETNKPKIKTYGNKKSIKKSDDKKTNNYHKQVEKTIKTVDKINAPLKFTNAQNNPNTSIAKNIHNPTTINIYKHNEPNGTIYNKNTENFTSTDKIYNKSTENDLSWIENIRYVREVTNEELERAYFEESFWDNLMFPSDWNDKDFDY